MRCKIELDNYRPKNPLQVGEVYAASGGRRLKYGHMYVVLAITDDNMVPCLVVNSDGDIVGPTQYGKFYFEERMPIGFADGIEGFQFSIRSI